MSPRSYFVETRSIIKLQKFSLLLYYKSVTYRHSKNQNCLYLIPAVAYTAIKAVGRTFSWSCDSHKLMTEGVNLAAVIDILYIIRAL